MRHRDAMARLGLLIVSIALPLALFFGLRERLFFDRFFYQKSMAHGYWPGDTVLADFGPRSEPIIALSEWVESHPEALDGPVLSGPDVDPSVYTVALFGDSFVFGQGLRFEHRFAVLLEDKLRELAGSRVIAFAVSGDSLLDHYVKYHALVRQGVDLDLSVFALVDNDLLLNGDRRYHPELIDRIESECGSLPIYRDLVMGDPAADELPYAMHLARSGNPERYGNVCVIERLAQKYLPRDRALYFDYGAPYRGPIFQRIGRPLAAAGVPLIDATGPLRKAFDPDPTRKGDPLRYVVSELDGHPSKAANRVFADVLFEAIVEHPTWKSSQSADALAQ